jgi:hypothetical protein
VAERNYRVGNATIALEDRNDPEALRCLGPSQSGAIVQTEHSEWVREHIAPGEPT